jgi:hypothetical protein
LKDEIVICGRCGRKLKSVKAKSIGYGSCCYKKVLKAELEAMQANDEDLSSLGGERDRQS